jgi:peptide/nickel transport system substrate-binding protein
METTWKIRPGAVWHDGAPFTAEDLLFTARVAQDKELAAFGHAAYAFVERMEAADAQTLLVVWKRPYIDADAMFSLDITPPLAQHVLEKPYLDDKTTFTQLPFWSQEYVGTGAYRLTEWVRGSHLVLSANDRYPLGRPKIDDIEVRFISDTNTLMANLLSGAVQITLGRALSVEQVVQLRGQWPDGTVSFEFGATSWLVLIPQFINPNPAVIGDLQLRRALLMAIDRQEMADSLNGGLSPVAHSYLSPDQPQYRDIEAHVRRYEYEPRQAAQMIEGLGYARGPDGVYHDGQGQRLEIEIRNIGLEISRRSMFAVADYWQRIGIPVSTIVIPPQRVGDFEYRSTFPGFQLFNQPNDLRGLPNLHSSRTRLPSNNYQVPGAGNHSRYMSPELDALLDRYYTTIPQNERIQALGQIVYHIAEHLNLMGLFYNGNPDAMSNRVQGITTGRAASSLLPWNVHEWDLQ